MWAGATIPASPPSQSPNALPAGTGSPEAVQLMGQWTPKDVPLGIGLKLKARPTPPRWGGQGSTVFGSEILRVIRVLFLWGIKSTFFSSNFLDFSSAAKGHKFVVESFLGEGAVRRLSCGILSVPKSLLLLTCHQTLLFMNSWDVAFSHLHTQKVMPLLHKKNMTTKMQPLQKKENH